MSTRMSIETYLNLYAFLSNELAVYEANENDAIASELRTALEAIERILIRYGLACRGCGEA